MYWTYLLTTYIRASCSAIVSSSRAHLRSLVSMPLLIKVVMLERISVIVSRVIYIAVQALESVRTRCSSYSSLSRRVSINLAIPS